MSYIDPEGMFGGDRMALLTDSAKLHWPWFWCASNTVGRVEINYRQFVLGPFRQFKKQPSEEQFWGWVAEYHEAFLLFVYRVNGQAWGQWDVSERYLPKYKLEADKRSPAPIAAEFLAWRDRYQESKINALSNKCRIFSVSENFRKVSESSGNLSIGEERRGEDKEQRAPESGALDLTPPEPKKKRQKTHRSTEEIRKALGAERSPWWDAFWDQYPCHDGMNSAMDVFERLVKTRDLATEIYRGAQRYAAKVKSDPTMKVKFAQGWLNSERWKDENRPVVPAEQRTIYREWDPEDIQ